MRWNEHRRSAKRAVATEFMQVAGAIALHPIVESFPLHEANEALQRVRDGALRGAAVLVPPHSNV